jgi:hypothetical protein
MAQQPRSQRFLHKSEAALIAAIEIYNKPDFRYREETFAILAVNAWELLLKAKLLLDNDNDIKCIYVYERRKSKKGMPTKKLFKKRNRAGNIQTLTIGQTIVEIEKKGVIIPIGVKKNIDALVEVRDNSIHYISAGALLSKQILEVSTASVSNFLRLSKEWFGHDLSKYHLHLMPIGFVYPIKYRDGIIVTTDEANIVKYLSDIIKASDVDPADPYQVALTLHLKMKRSSADTAIKVAITDDPDATRVLLAEEDIRAKYPWDYTELTRRLKVRYANFKMSNDFHASLKPLKKELKYCMPRYLDPGNPKSAKKDFYNPNILKELDALYTVK